MNINTGVFDDPKVHHQGWFRVFTFTGAVEIWLGTRWIFIDWSKP